MLHLQEQENDELIFWHARVLPANYHQTNNAGINRVENGQRIERLRFFNENIQYYTSSGSWKDFAATDQLVFYYLQRTELAKQVEILCPIGGRIVMTIQRKLNMN
ncbi:MAG: hypothetical protein ACLR0U_16330 [Enterocloster clostridioformis]